MARERHPGSQTTLEVRREIQRRRDEPSRKLALSLGLNPKTVDKWKRRDTPDDAPTGPKHPVSTALSAAQEALIVVFRKHTRLALDDRLARLRPLIPNLSRSALHRCLKRYGVSRIPRGRAKKLNGLKGGRELGVVTVTAVALPELGEEACLLFAIGARAVFVCAKFVDPLNANEAAHFLNCPRRRRFRYRRLRPITTKHSPTRRKIPGTHASRESARLPADVRELLDQALGDELGRPDAQTDRQGLGGCFVGKVIQLRRKFAIDETARATVPPAARDWRRIDEPGAPLAPAAILNRLVVARRATAPVQRAPLSRERCRASQAPGARAEPAPDRRRHRLSAGAGERAQERRPHRATDRS